MTRNERGGYSSIRYRGATGGRLRSSNPLVRIIAGILSLGVLLAAFIFAGIFIFGALLLGAALFVAFRIWRLFNKPDPEARQDFIIRTVQRGMEKRAGAQGPSARSNAGGPVIDGEAKEINPDQRP